MKKMMLVLGLFLIVVTGLSSCAVAYYPTGGYYGGYYGPYYGGWWHSWGYRGHDYDHHDGYYHGGGRTYSYGPRSGGFHGGHSGYHGR